MRNSCSDFCKCVSPPDGATLLVVDLDELAEATGIVVVGCLCVPKGLTIKQKIERVIFMSTYQQVEK